MELIFFFFAPWIACIVLFILLHREKNLRKNERASAEQKINNERASASNRIQDTELSSRAAVKSAEATAQSQIELAQRNAAEQIELAQRNATEQIAQVKAKSQADLAEMRQKAEQRIQTERELIQSNKIALHSLDDKELMIECMSALNTYAYRLDRLENQMSNITILLNAASKATVKEKTPYVHIGCITDADFINIVQDSAKRIGRITDFTVDEAVVKGTVLSQHKLSTWSFSIDFNDDGELTGNYIVQSDNADSNIPQRLAKEISKEIVYRLSISR